MMIASGHGPQTSALLQVQPCEEDPVENLDSLEEDRARGYKDPRAPNNCMNQSILVPDIRTGPHWTVRRPRINLYCILWGKIWGC